MVKIHVRSVHELQNNYAEILRLLNQQDHIIITNNGVAESVLINFSDYEAYQEYLHQRFIYDELQKSRKEAENPNIELILATDVFDRMTEEITD